MNVAINCDIGDNGGVYYNQQGHELFGNIVK